jgi:hypothetical protein
MVACDDAAKPGRLVRARVEASDGRILTARVLDAVEKQVSLAVA